MAEIQFFHLTEGPVAATLPTLFARAQERGWKVVVRGTSEARLDELDLALWRDQAGGIFLPHGRAGGAHDSLQPVLLALEGQEAVCDCLISVDGAGLTVEEAAAVTRSVIIFDGNDEAALQHARGQWKSLTGQGVPATYFAQEYGRWVKKAEKA